MRYLSGTIFPYPRSFVIAYLPFNTQQDHNNQSGAKSQNLSWWGSTQGLMPFLQRAAALDVFVSAGSAAIVVAGSTEKGSNNL